MASGQALAAFRRSGRKAVVLGENGERRWSDLWRDLGWIVQPGEDYADPVEVRNGPGARPYIDYTNGFPFRGKCEYTGWRCSEYPGTIAIDKDEKRFAEWAIVELGPFVILEPNISKDGNQNKQWGWDNWQWLAGVLDRKGVTLVQIGERGRPKLRHVHYVACPTFRHGVALLNLAAGAVLPEGGLHHAAGALRKRVVVLFGGCVPADLMGYPQHINLTVEIPGTPCGMWSRCEHCQQAWARLSPERIATALLDGLELC
jgi:hypothetical protein